MTNDSYTILGFDFGMKRIGVAVGQSITQTARPLGIIQAKKGVPEWGQVDTLIKKWRPKLLIVGMPLNMDGTEQKITQCARVFLNQLHDRFHLPVEEIDERLTTRFARDDIYQQGGSKALQTAEIDSVAAQFILQGWFNTHDQKNI